MKKRIGYVAAATACAERAAEAAAVAQFDPSDEQCKRLTAREFER
jgi:hypothetical protein